MTNENGDQNDELLQHCQFDKLPNPQIWLRKPVLGRWIAIMGHRRDSRRMIISPWTTRVIREGDIHEFVVTSSQPENGEVRCVSYLGFAALTEGVIALHDVVVTPDSEVGIVLGFDESHAPNHLNVILYSTNNLPGLHRRLTLEQIFEIKSSPSPSMKMV